MADFDYKKMFGEHTCYNCGQDVVVPDPKQYTYKRAIKGRVRYFCSWGCYEAHNPDKRRVRS